MTIFCDQDGVLADFDGLYLDLFGARPSREETDWKKVESVPDFYARLAPMRDAAQLWAAIEPYQPVILTGLPWSIARAESDKREWARRMFGNVPVICCASREKSLHCKPGDVLIDDYPRYRDFWEKAGGIFILHTSAAASIDELRWSLAARRS